MNLLLLAVLGLFGAITWKRAEAGLMLLAAWLPAYLIRFSFGIPFTFLELTLWTYVAIIVWKYRTRMAFSKRFVLLVSVFFLASVVGLVAAPDVRIALGLWRAYVLDPLLLGVAVWILPLSTKTLVRSFLLGAGITGAVMGLLASIQFVTGWGIPEPWDVWELRRAVAWFDFPNAIGLFLAPVGAAWAVAGWRGLLGRWWMWVPFSILHILGIFASVSEGAIVAMAGALLVCIYRYRSRFTAVIITSALLGAGLLTPSIRDVLLFQDVSGDVRLVLWEGTARLLTAHPLVGSGLGGFPMLYDLFREPSHVELLLYPHNSVLTFWTQFGLLGPIFLGLVAALVIWPIWRNRSDYSAVVLAFFVAVMIYGLVDVPYFKNDLAVMNWVMLVLALKIASLDKPGGKLV